MRLRNWLALFPTCLLAACAMAGEGPSSFKKADLAALPPNTWVQVGKETDMNKFLCSAWYLPASDEFLMWGKSGGGKDVCPKYDVETFDLRGQAWKSSFPKGKEEGWADGRFPNWTHWGYSPTGQEKCPIVKGASDRAVGGYASTNQVRFVEAEGVTRPTRCPTFHQGTYDTKRDRMLFFVGGKTFSYEPRERMWKDLKPAAAPLGCEALVWASLCYDPLNDQAVLFGGGMALNTWGGAKTWLYDCAANEWRRPELKIEPPLRCNACMVYDSKNKLIVLFGGDDQAKALNDTWVYDVNLREWSERKPATARPPARHYAAAFVEKHGVALFCGPEEKSGTFNTWTYDAARNVWTPIKGTVPAAEWLSCDYSTKDDAVVLVSAGSTSWEAPRMTYLYRLDPASAAQPRPGAAPGTPAWKAAGQRKSLLAAPPADRKAIEEKLKAMPVNEWVDADPPGAANNKTWTDCTLDTDKGVILYYGGGHSGYSGTDVAHYDVGENRWSLSYDPEFPPYLEGTNRTVFGWAYNLHPWSEHTRRWYAYDPVSKMMVYAREGGDLVGRTAWLGKDGRKAVKITGADNWVYDPAKRKFCEPTFDRPWSTNDGTCLVTTPKGVHALSAGKLWLCTVEKQGEGEDETRVAKWSLLSDKGPATGSECDPTLYDSKRNRLVSMVLRKTGPEMWCFDLGAGTWSKADCKGSWTTSREACYIPEEDVIFQVTYAAEGKPSVQQVYRCASSEWVQADIPLPKKGRPQASWDTSLAWDPVHKVVVLINEMGCGEPTTTFLLRYDDKQVKLAGNR